MKLELIDQIANAVLYEGYMLYPYRPTAVKNRQRWNFGVLYPQAYTAAQGPTEACSMQTECLVQTNESTELEVRVKFLHLLQREVGTLTTPGETYDELEPTYQAVESLEVDGELFQSWQEATEREVIVPAARIAALECEPRRLVFSFSAERRFELLRNKEDRMAGVIVRKQEPISGEITLSARRTTAGASRITVTITNHTPLDQAGCENRDRALLRSTVSTHSILAVREGEFLSLLDPPDQFREAAGGCRNVGAWPVLVGAEGSKDLMLSSPIILYDYPQIAPESAGDLFDGTEIDETLTLRIMTMTDEEKREMRGADALARMILERTEALPAEQLMRMHGTVRGMSRTK